MQEGHEEVRSRAKQKRRWKRTEDERLDRERMYRLIGTKSCPTRWRHQSILCMPDESTRLGSDTELTRRPTRSIRFRVKKTWIYIREIALVFHFQWLYFEQTKCDDLTIYKSTLSICARFNWSLIIVTYIYLTKKKCICNVCEIIDF